VNRSCRCHIAQYKTRRGTGSEGHFVWNAIPWFHGRAWPTKTKTSRRRTASLKHLNSDA